MSTSQPGLLKILISLAKIDKSLAQILAERKQMQDSISASLLQLKNGEADFSNRSRLLNDKKSMYQKEEKKLKEEREKLVARRKALSTLSNYKLQQAAEREIDAASKQLDAHEENMLGVLEEIDKLALTAAESEKQLNDLKAKKAELDKQANELFAALQERERAKLDEKMLHVKGIDAPSLVIYERTRERFPMDPVVPLKKDTCSGCFMSLGPQAVVLIGKGESVVKCRGCGRIVYVEDNSDVKS